MMASSASLNLPLEAENTFQIITLMRCSLMSLKQQQQQQKKGDKTYQPGGLSLSIQFQKAQFNLVLSESNL